MKNDFEINKMDKTNSFWSLPAQEQLKQLSTTPQGLNSAEANRRIKRYGANRLNNKKQTGNVQLFLAQFKNSIILILLFATGLSFFLNERVDAAIILTIVLISGCLGFWQEKGAASAIQKLLAMVQIKVNVLRDGIATDTATAYIVPGDVLLLKAGDVIPGDCLLLESDNLFVDEAILTGESYPVEKLPGGLPVDAALSQRTNALWMGTHVQSGDAKYSKKVLNATDAFHNFPKSVDGFAAKFGQYSTKIGSSGNSYQWLEMSGSYGGKTGTFEYIKDANGLINHRFFNVPKAP